jgi:hypothetical protein
MPAQALVDAKHLESSGILPRHTALKMAKAGLLPHYKVGPKRDQ